MRFFSVASLATVAAPLAVSAARGQLGYALGDRTASGACKVTADWEADFAVLNTHIVRTYSSSECDTAEQILPAAAKHGIQVILGVWHTDSAYAADKAALQKAIPANPGAVYAITVGSETLYRGDLTASELLKKIRDMQDTFPHIKVGTADSWNKYADGTADPVVQGGVKFLLVNAFAYWQGQKISNATATYLDDLMQAYTRIQQTAGSIDSIELWNGETGWPGDGGSDYGDAVASTANEETFFKKGLCAALEWGFNAFYFEAFDDPSKPMSTGDTGAQGDETHWGAYTAERVPKFSLSSTPSISGFATSSPPTRAFNSYCVRDGSDTHSRSTTVWTAPSPSQIFLNTSPSLPSLANSLDSAHPLSNSPPPHYKSDNSAYYTARWSTPQRLEAIPELRLKQRRCSVTTANESSSQLGSLTKPRSFAEKQVQNRTSEVSADASDGDHIRKRNTTLRLESPLALGSARYRYTQDWLRNNSACSNDSDKGSLWSDESDCSDKESSCAFLPVGNSDSENTSSQLRSGRGRIISLSFSHKKLHRGCVKHEISNASQPSVCSSPKKSRPALVKQDLCRPVESRTHAGIPKRMPTYISTDAQSLTDAVVKNKTQNMEKALPPTPPPERTGSEEPSTNKALDLTVPAPAIPQLPGSSQSSFQRPRVRVIWGKKTCIIALPLINGQDERLIKKTYLTPKDVEDRFIMWERQGFNTRGFSLTPNSEGLAENLASGQSRVIYPDLERGDESLTPGFYRVSIPNRQEWEDYVRRVKEEKLRSLGVSSSEGELSITDPSLVPSMIRHTSSQSSSMPISPLFAASPNAGLHGNQNLNMYLPPLVNSMSLGNHKISHPAPGLQEQGKPKTHPSKYPKGLPVSDNEELIQVQSPLSGNWPPQHYLSSPSSSRMTSPAINGQIKSLGNTHQPLPLSIHDPRIQGVNHLQNGGLVPIIYQQAQIQSQFLQQQQQYQILPQPQISQTLAGSSHKADEARSTIFRSQPEIVNPIPRGHRQNLSETLQRELDEIESQTQVSNTFTSQRVKGTPDRGNKENFGIIEDITGLSSTPQNSNRDISLDGSDLGPNPVLTETPKTQETPNGLVPRYHSPKSSTSKLNVNAPEFVYGRSKDFVPEVFAFRGSQSTTSSLTTEAAQTSKKDKNPRYSYKDSNINSNLSVEAPAFTPANVPLPPIPPRAFSFSKKLPAYQPETPNVSSNSAKNPVNGRNAQLDEATTNKIFTNINYHEIIKPTRKSQAIPIVKPKSPPEISGQDADGQEDESGRITQPDGRQKRIRRNNDNDDEVPLFHEMPSAPKTVVSLELARASSPNVDIKEATGEFEISESQPKEIVSNLASEISSRDGNHPTVDVGSKPWEPFTFENAQDAANFNAALSVLPSLGKGVENLNTNSLDVGEQNIKRKPESRTSSVLDRSGDHDQFAISAIRDVGRDSLPDASEILEETFSRVLSQSDIGSIFNASVLPLENLITARSRSASQSSSPTDGPPTNDVGNFTQEIRNGQKEALNPDTNSTLLDGVAYLPSYHEIDAVMQHLNEDSSELGAERNPSPWRKKSPILTPIAQLDDSKAGLLFQMPHMRSDAPSPSPNRLQQPFQYLPESDLESPPSADVEMVARNARFSPSYRPSKEFHVTASPVHRLNSPNNIPVSDWDDLISSTEELKFRSRARFFDHRINDLVGGIVQQRLSPFEKALGSIQRSLATLSNKAIDGRSLRSYSGELVSSDADDEDEDNTKTSGPKSRSPLKDRTYEKLRALFAEKDAAQQRSTLGNELFEIKEAVKELSSSIQQPLHSHSDIKTIVEEAVARQMRGRSGQIVSSHTSAAVEKLQLQITGLESMLKIAESRADDELKARRATEDALADNQRLLRIAMQEAAEQRESAEETERSLSAFHDERQHVLRRTALLEGSQESLQKTASDLTAKNAALEDTLAEYRLSSSQWRHEIGEAKAENKDLQRTINALKIEIEDSIRGRQNLRAKFDRLQEDMTLASKDIARDQSRWRKVEEENKASFNLMKTKLETESRTREKLELEIMTLLKQEKETTVVRHNLEQCQRVISQQDELLDNLRLENLELQNAAARHERELHDVKERAKMEIERIRTSADLDIETANNQVNIVSSDLQRVIARTQNQLDEVTADLSCAKAKYSVMVEEASESRKIALQEAIEAKETAVKEHKDFHERVLAECNAQHSHALDNSLEDKRLLEVHLNNRLALADEKVLHLQDKVSHLEEKLELAKSAAQAAAVAAQSKIASSPSINRTSTPLVRGSEIPQKISPQALRESILVLQEQLQEREGRIEQLELDISQVDKDTPTRLKEREAEVIWLRELLSVRVDDLEDIIMTLSQPSYDREATKDAAIRLKANLQMEQQEKERALGGNQAFPSLTSISSLASSPRALPLAAAAAWGNWRKARDTSFGSLSGVASGNVNQTPSRASPSSQGFLSGLLTPPSTTRPTSQSNQNTRSSRHTPLTAKPASGIYQKPRESLSLQDEHRPLRTYQSPKTPPLMRKASYDGDAGSLTYSNMSSEERKDLAHENSLSDEPFGLTIRKPTEHE